MNGVEVICKAQLPAANLLTFAGRQAVAAQLACTCSFTHCWPRWCIALICCFSSSLRPQFCRRVADQASGADLPPAFSRLPARCPICDLHIASSDWQGGRSVHQSRLPRPPPLPPPLPTCPPTLSA